MTTREQLHALIDALPNAALPAAERLLKALQPEHDPVWQAFQNVPEDDAPLTEEDVAALREADEDEAQGDVMTWEQYVARHHDRPSRATSTASPAKIER